MIIRTWNLDGNFREENAFLKFWFRIFSDQFSKNFQIQTFLVLFCPYSLHIYTFFDLLYLIIRHTVVHVESKERGYQTLRFMVWTSLELFLIAVA